MALGGKKARPWLAWGGACAAAAIVVGYLGWTLTALEGELTEQAREVTSLQQGIARQQALLKPLVSPNTQVVALNGLEPSPAAQGRIWWHREAGGLFVARGLPAPPAGRVYQLWAIAGGTPLAAGVFDVDAKGSAALRVEPLPGVEKVEAFAVTLEPAGGLPKPSGARYLAGKAP